MMLCLLKLGILGANSIVFFHHTAKYCYYSSDICKIYGQYLCIFLQDAKKSKDWYPDMHKKIHKTPEQTGT